MIRDYLGTMPKLDPTAWVADDADVIGDVVIAADASVWYQTVIRGDVAHVRIGRSTNIQDHTTIHVTRDGHPTEIGDEVTIGHRGVVHGATVKDGALIGIGAIVLDDAVVGEGALVGAMSLVTPGTVIPPGTLVMGQPARVVRDVGEAERKWMVETVANYVALARDHAKR